MTNPDCMKRSHHSPFRLFTFPLVVYEITFALFVIYYIQPGSLWLSISLISIAVSVLIIFLRIISTYSKWSGVQGPHKKIFLVNLYINFLFFALYLFCFLAHLDQRKEADSPSLVFICLLAAPPLTMYALYLYFDAKQPDILKQDE